MKEYEANRVLDYYLDLRDVFKMYGYEIYCSGFCCCPFHVENTPSCRVTKIQYHCFGCGAKGNAVSFVKNLFKLDFKDAIQKLNDDFHLGLLSTELTQQQREDIRKRQIKLYNQKNEKTDLQEIEEEYLNAWKNYIIYKPEPVDYDINTDQYLVDSWFEKLDKRYIQAISDIDRLEDIAYVNNFNIDEDYARMIFIK